jgi:hypothetical protein
MNKLNEDIYNEIFRWLPSIDLIYTKPINKFSYDLINKIINTRVKACITDYEPALLSLINENVVISGSFVLQVLSSESWDGDIDIYCNEPDWYNIISTLKNYGYDCKNLDGYPFMKETSCDKFRVSSLTCRDTEKKIDVIINKNPIGIIEQFDFDIVQNLYDGTHIKIRYPESVRNKTVYHFNEECNFNVSRYHKYSMRNFVFPNETIKNINKSILQNYDDIYEYIDDEKYYEVCREIFIYNKYLLGNNWDDIHDIFDYIMEKNSDGFIEFLRNNLYILREIITRFSGNKINCILVEDLFI